MKRTKEKPRFGGVLPQRESPRKPWLRRNWMWVLAALLAAVLIYCLAQWIGFGRQARETEQANQSLRDLHVEAEATQAPVPTAPAPSPSPDVTARPLPTAPPEAAPAAPTDAPEKEFQFVGGEEDILPGMRKLYARNPDLVGWLKIPGVVDLPVVYRDNQYYLYRDFNGRDSIAGTLFLDSLHPLRAGTQQLVIHGHNMKDGTMFGHLVRYLDRSFAAAHRTIQWTSLYRRETYELVAVVLTSIDPKDARYIAYLGKARFASEEGFQALMDAYRAQATYWPGAYITPGDALLTLSTCRGDERILVVARRVAAE